MIFTLYQAPVPAGGQDTSFDTLQAIPETTSKAALLFPPFWLAWHGLWWALAFYALLFVIAMTLLATSLAGAALLLGGLPGLYLYLEGHQLRRNRLERQGYVHVATVEAPDASVAIERYLAQWNDENGVALLAPARAVTFGAQSDTSRAARDDDMAFGLFPDPS